VSERRVCTTMSMPRSAVRERATKPRVPMIDDVLAARLQRLIAQHPTFGYRRLWALLRFHDGLPVNRKAYTAPLQVDATQTTVVGRPRRGGSRWRMCPRTCSDGRRSAA